MPVVVQLAYPHRHHREQSHHDKASGKAHRFGHIDLIIAVDNKLEPSIALTAGTGVQMLAQIPQRAINIHGRGHAGRGHGQVQYDPDRSGGSRQRRTDTAAHGLANGAQERIATGGDTPWVALIICWVSAT